MSRVVPTAIACCANCLTGFPLHEWIQLEVVNYTGDVDGVESKKCHVCGASVVGVIAGMPEGGLWLEEDHHSELYPVTSRESIEQPKPSEVPRMAGLALVAIVVVWLFTILVKVTWSAF